MSPSDPVDHNRLRRQQRQAQQQGLTLSLQRTPTNRRPYYVVLSTTPRDVAVTMLFSLDEVGTFLVGDPALRESTERTSHIALEDAEMTDLRTGQVIQHLPRP